MNRTRNEGRRSTVRSFLGMDHPAGAPDGQSFRTTSSFVVEDGTGYDRVAVVGRSSAGRIYERYYQCVNGVQSGWTWNDLSIKPVFNR